MKRAAIVVATLFIHALCATNAAAQPQKPGKPKVESIAKGCCVYWMPTDPKETPESVFVAKDRRPGQSVFYDIIESVDQDAAVVVTSQTRLRVEPKAKIAAFKKGLGIKVIVTPNRGWEYELLKMTDI
jgi:hypothetical protein